MEIHKKNNDRPVAFIDIDETICFYESERIYEKAKPNYGSIAKINKLYNDGWKIVYWTARGSSDPYNKKRIFTLRKLTISQLHEWGCEFDELKMGDEKPLFDLVIDDKAKRIEEL